MCDNRSIPKNGAFPGGSFLAILHVHSAWPGLFWLHSGVFLWPKDPILFAGWWNLNTCLGLPTETPRLRPWVVFFWGELKVVSRIFVQGFFKRGWYIRKDVAQKGWVVGGWVMRIDGPRNGESDARYSKTHTDWVKTYLLLLVLRGADCWKGSGKVMWKWCVAIVQTSNHPWTREMMSFEKPPSWQFLVVAFLEGLSDPFKG